MSAKMEDGRFVIEVSTREQEEARQALDAEWECYQMWVQDELEKIWMTAQAMAMEESGQPQIILEKVDQHRKSSVRTRRKKSSVAPAPAPKLSINQDLLLANDVHAEAEEKDDDPTEFEDAKEEVEVVENKLDISSEVEADDEKNPSSSSESPDKKSSDDQNGDWMTDDESEMDANTGTVKKNVLKPKRDATIVIDSVLASPPKSKALGLAKKKKMSEYFTPQAFEPRSTRASTRAIPRVAQYTVVKQAPTPFESATAKASATKAMSRIKAMTKNMKESVTSSGGSIASSTDGFNRNFGSSARSNRYVSRLKAPGSASKDLTDSAQKKRREEEEKRRIMIQQQIDEREKRALQQKEQLMLKKAQEAKMKREEREKLVGQHKEAIENDERNKRMLVDHLREEAERKKREKEEMRREETRIRQEQILLKQQETEQRKVQDEKERQLRQRQQEEMLKKRLEEAERVRIEEAQLAARIAQHNSSLQQKAVANSFMKKQAVIQTQAPVAIPSTSKMPDVCSSEPPKLEKQPPVPQHNSTFTMSKDAAKGDEVQQPQAVPKTGLTSYDIDDLKSDGESDDERQPRKPLPDWARGQLFMSSLTKQYSKPTRYREREVRHLFPTVLLPVDLGNIFKGAEKIVSSRYAKRTSSAYWSSPPAHALNLSYSMNSSTMSRVADFTNESFTIPKQK